MEATSAFSMRSNRRVIIFFFWVKSEGGPGDGILIPRPTYWYFDLLGGVYGLDKRYYGCDIDGRWEVDFEDLISKIDARTKVLVFVNPGNPSCVAYSKETIGKYLEIAEKYGLIVLADEIYFDSVFPGTTHTTIFQMGKYDTVPISNFLK
jgi:alanine-synthesizing transaminase